MKTILLKACPKCGNTKLGRGSRCNGHGDYSETITCSCGLEYSGPYFSKMKIEESWNDRGPTKEPEYGRSQGTKGLESLKPLTATKVRRLQGMMYKKLLPDLHKCFIEALANKMAEILKRDPPVSS